MKKISDKMVNIDVMHKLKQINLFIYTKYINKLEFAEK